MSEVYIRSQNREKLYRLGGNYACVEYGAYEERRKRGEDTNATRHAICISDGCLEEIGVYATKERCLEVLDELQKVCGSYLSRSGGMEYTESRSAYKQPIVAELPRIYEMPPE